MEMETNKLDYIKIPDLKHHGLYRIRARNATYGIWLEDEEGFMISRHKFYDNFLFVEYHWDCPAWATARPLSFVEQSPFEPNDFEYVEKTTEEGRTFHGHRKSTEILEYLNKFEGTLEERTAQGRR